MDYRDKCSKIKHLADIEDIVSICLDCSFQITCQVWYLLQTQKRAGLFDRCRKGKTTTDLKSNPIECSNGFTVCSNDSDKPHSALIRSILRRSIVVKKTASDETECNFCQQTKKVVRFADELGLALVEMSEISNSTAHFKSAIAYKIEESSDDSDTSNENAYFSRNMDYSYKQRHPHDNNGIFIFDKFKLKWNIMFTQPCLDSKFFVLLNEHKVILENLYTSDKWINGIVRVLNVSFNKSVFLRYTTDNWLSYKDTFASYVTNSCDGLTDRFNFRFCIEDDIIRERICKPVNDHILFKIQFAVCFQSDSNLFWDNNNKENYAIECTYIPLRTE